MPNPYSRGERHEIFQLAVHAFVTWWSGDQPIIEFEEHELTLAQACNLVWGCSDILPEGYFDEVRDVLDMKRRTYAAVARAMRASL